MKFELILSQVAVLLVFVAPFAFCQNDQSKSEQLKGADIWNQIVNEEVQATKDKGTGSDPNRKADETKSQQAGHQDAAAIDAMRRSWCDALLHRAIRAEDLPQGYSRAQVSSTEMTPEERAAGMVCKISVNLQGPDPFNAIRFRIFVSPEAAQAGLKSLDRLVPEIRVIDSQLWYGNDTPCMAYTSRNSPLTFISCGGLGMGDAVIVTGVTSQATAGSSYNTAAIPKAGRLLDAGKKVWEDLLLSHPDQLSHEVFGEDRKK